MSSCCVIVPVIVPMPFDADQVLAQNAMIDELRQLDCLNPGKNVLSDIRIRYFDSPAEIPLLDGTYNSEGNVRQHRFISFEVDVTDTLASSLIEIKTYLERSEQSIGDPLHFARDMVSTDVRFEIDKFFLLANVISPGSISADVGYVYFEEEFFENTDPFLAEDLFGAVEVSVKADWPSLSKVTLAQAWNWLRDSDAIVDGVGITAVGRALAAVSHLTTSHHKESSSLDIVWILLGLEALYSQSNVGLTEQLIAKSEVILGPRVAHKKMFGSAYNFRSRLLHGGVDIPLRFSNYDATKKFEAFHDQLYSNSDVCLSVLIGTLQWMISNNRHELDFRYALVPHQNAADERNA